MNRGQDRAVLVLISGLQGTGKSTLAAAVATALDADQTMLAAEALAEGRNVVVECVMAPELRQGWVADAAALDVGCLVVECVCSDLALHEAACHGEVRRRAQCHQLATRPGRRAELPAGE